MRCYRGIMILFSLPSFHVKIPQNISQLLLSLSRNFPLLPLQRMLHNRISKISHSLVRQRDFRKKSKERNSPTEVSSQRPRERCNSSGIWCPFSCRYCSFDILVMAHLCCECAHQYGSLILSEDVVELGGARWWGHFCLARGCGCEACEVTFV